MKLFGQNARAALDATETPASLRTKSTTSLFGNVIEDADLLFAVKREPISYRLIVMVAQDVWDNGFTIENATEQGDKDLNHTIQKKLEALKAKYYLTRLTVYERLFGYGVLALGYSDYGGALEKPVTSPVEIKDLEVFGKQEISSVEEDGNPESERFGLPEYYNVRVSGVGALQSRRMHFSRCIHAATRLIDHKWQGISVLSPVYDDSVAHRLMRWSLAMILLRYGAFIDVELKGAGQNKIDAFIASGQFDAMDVRKYFVHNEMQEMEVKSGAQSALNPTTYLQPSVEAISGGSGIPEPILRGAQAGALTGSEVNERAYFKMISDVQTSWEPVLRQLIDKLLEIEYRDGEVPEYVVKWNPSFELTEEVKAQVELWKSETAKNLTTLMTLDEVRKKLYDLGELPDGQGLIVVGAQPKQPQELPPQGFMQADQHVPEIEQKLGVTLQGIVESAKQGKLTRDDALLAARITIQEHVSRMTAIVKQRIESKIGRSITNFSPEQQREFTVWVAKYNDSFKKILDDALGGRPNE